MYRKSSLQAQQTTPLKRKTQPYKLSESEDNRIESNANADIDAVSNDEDDGAAHHDLDKMIQNAANVESESKRPMGNKRAKLEARRESLRTKLFSEQDRRQEAIQKALEEQADALREANNISLFVSMPDCPAKTRFFEIQAQLVLKRLEATIASPPAPSDAATNDSA